MSLAKRACFIFPTLLFLTVAGFLSCEGLAASEVEKQEVQQKNQKDEKGSYRIQPGDVLSIDVWRVPLLSVEARVELDGALRYPLLGSVPAEGKTLDEVRDYLTAELGKSYLVDPLVTVSRSSKIKGFFVVGEVKGPGSFQFEERINVYQAIIMAGGFTDFASKNVKIIRKSGKERKVIKVNVKKLEKEGAIDPEAQIQPGDTVVVPKRWL